MKLNSSDKFKPTQHLISKFLGNQVYIFDKKKIKVHTLNQTASLIWRLINKNQNLADITKRICSEFEVDKKTAQKDIVSFLKKYINQNMLTLRNR